MTELEELAAQAAVANQEAEKQNTILRTLENELEQNAETLDSRAYSDLKARIELQEMRTASASARALEKQAALDEVRTAEAAKLQREAAQRAVDATLTRLNETRAALESKRKVLSELQSELPRLEQKTSFLLFELNAKRETLQRLGA